MKPNSEGATVFSGCPQKSGKTVLFHGLVEFIWQFPVDTVSPGRLQAAHYDKHYPAYSARHSRQLNPSPGAGQFCPSQQH
jgi:hypothetical protein